MRRLVVAAVGMAFLAWACTDGREPEPAPRPSSGGTLRVGLLSDLRAGLDPQREYNSVAFELYRCCLLRTLFSYRGLPSGEGGAELVPDLATGAPTVSSDGLTWTFKLKQGIHYAPPVQNTRVIAQDFIRALEREANPETSAGGYWFYYGVIRGFDEYRLGTADSIAGLEAPNDRTLVVTLNEPSGDLGHRMSLPAAAPIPEGVSDGHEQDYGRFLIASGPYMLEGSRKLDLSEPPGRQDPIPGYRPGKGLTLVRNPSWDPDTDGLRPAYPDRIEVTIGRPPDHVAELVEEGTLDLQLDGVPPYPQVRELQASSQGARVFVNRTDIVQYAAMSLAAPPFDDVHVRRAVNLIVDKQAILRAAGGPLVGRVTGRVFPGSMLGPSAMQSSDPYATPRHRGDLQAAREEMALSRYDADGDGVCDERVCRAVLAVVGGSPPYPQIAARIGQDLEGLGIHLDLDVTTAPVFYEAGGDPKKPPALALPPPWRGDFPDAGTFAVPLASTAAIGPDSCCNLSLLGAAPGQLEGLHYEVSEVPSVQGTIEECQPLQGTQRLECWSLLDRKLMDEVVPWIPFFVHRNVDVVSERVVSYSLDGFTGLAALDRIALRIA